MQYLFTVLSLTAIISACHSTNFKNQPQELSALNDQKKLVQHFTQMGYTTAERNQVALIHVCTLNIAQRPYPVIDLRELVKSPNSPRGVNRIVILNEQLKKLATFDYSKSRPLLCRNNKLYLGDEIQLSNFSTSGNVLTLDENGQAVQLELIEPAAWF